MITLIILIFTFFNFAFFRKCFVVVIIEHESMSPTLHSGDRVLVFRYWPAKLLKKGDIVIVWPWINIIRNDKGPKPFGVIPYIKRIIGLPGDKIISNIHELDDYHKKKFGHNYDEEGNKTEIIPEKHFFVRGDFPIGGIDSRIFGPVPKEGILGLVILKLPK